MATLNRVMLIGRLTTDPEPPRTLPNGMTVVVKFRFAVGRSKKNDQGGWDKDPNQLYIDCEAFHNSNSGSKRNLPDLITKYAKKGDLLYIEGRLVFEEWPDKNNPQQKRSKHKLVVDGIEFLGGRQGEDGGEGGGRSYGGGSRQTSGGRSAPPPDEPGDDFGESGGSGGSGDPIPF